MLNKFRNIQQLRGCVMTYKQDSKKKRKRNKHKKDKNQKTENNGKDETKGKYTHADPLDQHIVPMASSLKVHLRKALKFTLEKLHLKGVQLKIFIVEANCITAIYGLSHNKIT